MFKILAEEFLKQLIKNCREHASKEMTAVQHFVLI
jgi:hypothetical protein